MERCSCTECQRIQRHIHTLVAGFFRAGPAQPVTYRLQTDLYRNFEAAQAYQAYAMDMEVSYVDA